MNRSQLKKLSNLRVKEAKVLFRAQQYEGAYYLIGYAVECGLKACIAKQFKRHDFPDKRLVEKAHTHKVEALLKLAGLETAFQSDRRNNPTLDLNWAIVKDWSEEERYNDNISINQARDLISACTGRGGILPWIKRRW